MSNPDDLTLIALLGRMIGVPVENEEWYRISRGDFTHPLPPRSIPLREPKRKA